MADDANDADVKDADTKDVDMEDVRVLTLILSARRSNQRHVPDEVWHLFCSERAEDKLDEDLEEYENEHRTYLRSQWTKNTLDVLGTEDEIESFIHDAEDFDRDEYLSGEHLVLNNFLQSEQPDQESGEVAFNVTLNDDELYDDKLADCMIRYTFYTYKSPARVVELMKKKYPRLGFGLTSTPARFA